MTEWKLGIVAIGRNEGERLRRCLESAAFASALLVYVDSGSTDGSVEVAHQYSAVVVDLDLSIPFTAARARNAGFKRLFELAPTVQYVQFVDADCEIVGGWLDAAMEFLGSKSDVAVVGGRRRERYRNASIYNLVCDIEWRGTVGQVNQCGGDAMIRVDALQSIGGYREVLIAGEEMEMCSRLRRAGWKIWSLDVEMTVHDAAMYKFGQWWTRAKRTGFVYAESVRLYWRDNQCFGLRESISVWLWVLGIPGIALALSAWSVRNAIAVFMLYPAQYVRLMLRGKHSCKENAIYAMLLMLAKYPQLFGQLSYLRQLLSGRRRSLIEYK